MYLLKTESSFDSAHFLAEYNGKCRNLHGHRWRVIIEVKTEKLEQKGQEKGMITDFGLLKKALREETEKLDHALIYEEHSLKEVTKKALEEEQFLLIAVPFRPTAEQFAKYFFDKLEQKGYDVKRAIVYETPNNCAVYEEKE